MIKHSGHLRTLDKCRKHLPAARVFYISLVFSNDHHVLSQCNTRLRLLYLLNKQCMYKIKEIACVNDHYCNIQKIQLTKMAFLWSQPGLWRIVYVSLSARLILTSNHYPQSVKDNKWGNLQHIIYTIIQMYFKLAISSSWLATTLQGAQNHTFHSRHPLKLLFFQAVSCTIGFIHMIQQKWPHDGEFLIVWQVNLCCWGSCVTVGL